MDALKKFSKSSLFLPFAALFLLLVFNAIFVDDFFKIQMMDNGNLYGRPIDILYRASSLIILSLGMTFVIATGGVDISVGAVVAISAATCCLLLGGDISGVPDYPFIVAILAALGAGVLSGIWNGTLVAKFKIQAMVATLILMTSGRGIAQLLTDGQIITVYYKPFSYIGGVIPGFMLPTAMLIAIFMVCLVIFLDKRTSLGLMIQSVGINPTAARYAGVKVTAVLFAVYIFSGFCAGTAGLIESSLIRAADANNAGLNMEMDAILAVTLGGTLMVGGRYYIGGTIIGAITIQTLTTTMYAIGVPSDILPAIKAVVILLIITIQSDMFREMYRNYRLASTKNDESNKPHQGPSDNSKKAESSAPAATVATASAAASAAPDKSTATDAASDGAAAGSAYSAGATPDVMESSFTPHSKEHHAHEHDDSKRGHETYAKAHHAHEFDSDEKSFDTNLGAKSTSVKEVLNG